MPKEAPQLVPAVDRAIRMLVALRVPGDGQRLSDLARELGIPKSSAHQIAATLLHHGVLDRDEDTRRYRLGAGLARVASGRQAKVDLPLLAVPYLEDLAGSTRMTAVLGARIDDGVILVAKADSPSPIDISAPVGHRVSERTGVFGKMFAAALGPNELEELLRKPLPAFTAQSIVDSDAYKQDLHRLRQRGFAIDVEEYIDGVVAVGAPVRDRRGEVVAGVCLLGLAASHDRSRLSVVGEEVRAVGESLSYDLGFESARPTDRTVIMARPRGVR